MKKRLGIVLIVIFGVICFGKSANTYASERNVSSCGELDFENGKAVMCAEDILYLQKELNKLFNEITN